MRVRSSVRLLKKAGAVLKGFYRLLELGASHLCLGLGWIILRLTPWNCPCNWDLDWRLRSISPSNTCSSTTRKKICKIGANASVDAQRNLCGCEPFLRNMNVIASR